MNKFIEKLKSSPEVARILMFILGAACVVLVTNNFFSTFAPFLVAYVVLLTLRPLMNKIKEKTKIPNAINTIICMFLFIAIACVVLWLTAHYLIKGAEYLIQVLTQASTLDKITVFANNAFVKVQSLADFFDFDVNTIDWISSISGIISKIVTSLSNFGVNLVMKIPSIILSLVIGAVAAFYLLYDYENISAFVKKQLSPSMQRIVSVLNTQVFFSLIKMVFSYALLSVVCFVELLVGFLIIGIENAALIALIIAILDVMPILGSGAILIPWGIITMIAGKPLIGVILIAYWIIIIVVRQVLEPKVVGSQIGLHPLVTVLSLFLGLKLMGGVGLLIGPMYVLVCKQLNEEGIIHLYKFEPKATPAPSEHKLLKKIFKRKNK